MRVSGCRFLGSGLGFRVSGLVLRCFFFMLGYIFELYGTQYLVRSHVLASRV